MSARALTLARVAAIALVLSVLAVTAAAYRAAEAAPTPTRAELTARLPRALSPERMRADLRALQRIADRSGGSRAAGTPGYRESVRYVRRELEKAGYDVRVAGFSFVEFRELVERGRQTTPVDRDLRVEALEYSPSTPKGGLQSRAVPSGDGCQREDFDDVGGSIALVRRGDCFFAVKAQNAARAGAVAVIVFNSAPSSFDGTLDGPRASSIPAVAISGRLGEELATSSNVTVQLEISTSRRRSTSQNVIAELRPHSEPVLLVGAHLDSVREGAGINDNGTGVAALLEIARTARRTAPQLEVRFAFWGAEELGLFGSTAYARTVEPSDLVGYLNFDMLGSPSRRHGVYEGGPFAARWLAYFARRGLPATAIGIGGRSDHFPFQQRGIPVGGLFSGGEYACYHRFCDRLSKVDFGVFEELSSAAAFGVASFAPLTRGGG